jgi:hypothetical protein
MWVLSSGRYTEDHPKGVGVGTGMGLAKVDAGATAVAAAVDWAREMEGAKMLMASGLLPQAIKRPEQALFVILAGRDLGLSPVQSLRSINVVQGKVELAADMQLSLFHRAGGKSKWEALTNDRAALWLNAPWLEAPHVETFTMEDAKRAGLTGDNWRKYPKAMLRSRAITAGLKSIGFDVLAGHYAEGELGGPEPVIVEEAPTMLGGEVVDPRTIAPNWGMAGEEGEAAVVGTIAPQTETVAEIVADDDTADAERLAREELEAVMPTLTENVQRWVRNKLSEGATPAALLTELRKRGIT